MTGTADRISAESGVSSVFRRVNDSIRELAGRAAGDDTWNFFCECDDAECRDLIALTVGEFDARRDNGLGAPILAAVHASQNGSGPR